MLSAFDGPYLVTDVKRTSLSIDDTDRKQTRTVSMANAKLFRWRTPPPQFLQTQEPIRTTDDTDSREEPPAAKSPRTELTPQPIRESPAADQEMHDRLRVYEVEKIRSHDKDRGRSMLYLVQWKGCAKSESTWEPRRNIQGVECLRDYWRTASRGQRCRNDVPAEFRDVVKKGRK